MTIVLPGESITAAMLNGLELPAWSSFTPTLTAQTGTPTLGNAVYTAKYVQAGKFVTGIITLTMGTTTTYGTGILYVALPVATSANMAGACCGSGVLIDTSASARNTCGLVIDGSNQRVLMHSSGRVGPAFGDIITSAVPWTWASTDVMRLNFTYEAA